MSKPDMRRASLQELRRLKDSGKLRTDLSPKEGEDLGPDFWADAEWVEPSQPRSVRLNLDPEVFDYFKAQGKGHITRMQNVLAAYVRARKAADRKRDGPGGR